MEQLINDYACYCGLYKKMILIDVPHFHDQTQPLLSHTVAEAIKKVIIAHIVHMCI